MRFFNDQAVAQLGGVRLVHTGLASRAGGFCYEAPSGFLRSVR